MIRAPAKPRSNMHALAVKNINCNKFAGAGTIVANMIEITAN